MKKFLYLTKKEWCNAWVNGGEVPISLASKYVSEERDGVLTPDENVIMDTNAPIDFINDRIHPNAGTVFRDCWFVTQSGNYFINRSIEDGLIMSFCNVFSIDIAHRLGKTACVEIHNIKKLKKRIDKKIGIRGVMRKCEYTDSAIRDHFIKGCGDAWQDEYRLFYKSEYEKMISIPKDTASVVWVQE